MRRSSKRKVPCSFWVQGTFVWSDLLSFFVDRFLFFFIGVLSDALEDIHQDLENGDRTESVDEKEEPHRLVEMSEVDADQDLRHVAIAVEGRDEGEDEDGEEEDDHDDGKHHSSRTVFL